MGKRHAAVTMFWWLGSGIHGAWIGRTLSKHPLTGGMNFKATT